MINNCRFKRGMFFLRLLTRCCGTAGCPILFLSSSFCFCFVFAVIAMRTMIACNVVKFIICKNRQWLHSFVCWNLHTSPQNMYKHAPPAFKAGFRDRFFIAFLFGDLFHIVTEYLMLSICLSHFLWNASSLASSVCVRAHGRAHVLQL